MKLNMTKRSKNIYLYLGLIGIVFSAAGIDFNSLTNWGLFMDGLLAIVKNPVALVSVIFAVLGVFVDPTTPGLADKE